jgi:hypothetical protein
MPVSFSAYYSTLKLEATSVDINWTKQRYVAEDGLFVATAVRTLDPTNSFIECTFKNIKIMIPYLNFGE